MLSHCGLRPGKALLMLLCIVFMATGIFAQGDPTGTEWLDDLYAYRQMYHNEYLNGQSAPLSTNDTAYLDFYAPDQRYVMQADIDYLKDSVEVSMPTFSGKIKKFHKVARLKLKIDGKKQVLFLYQSAKTQSGYADYLFLPFTDATNGETTYGGGRYLELKPTSIHKNKLTIDFNKAFNPLCVYSDKYNCPIPPAENHLTAKIEAGEKMYKKPKKKAEQESTKLSAK